MPIMDATSATRLIAHGLFHWGRRPSNPVSKLFFIPFGATSLSAVRAKPRGEDGDVQTGDSRFSIVPFPLRASGKRRSIEREGRGSGLRRRSRLFAGCADDLDSVVLLKREELTSGPSTGGGPSSSDEPDECLLIPAGAGGGRCLTGGGTTVGSGGFGVGGPSEWEKGAAVKRYYSWGVPS
jgi:hypothetical protein